jgi:hypothetical protein
MTTRFYDVHVFYSRQDGYSIPVKIETSESLTDDEVIEFAEENSLFTDGGDGNHVDYVTEITEEEYNDLIS